MHSVSESIGQVEEESERTKIGLLFRNVGTALAVNLVNASLLAFVNVSLGASLPWALSWCGLLLVVVVWRYLLAHRVQPAQLDEALATRWLRRYLFATTFSAAIWGSGAVLFVWNAPVTAQLFTGLVLAGMVAGAVPLLAPVLRLFQVFALLVIVPLVLAIALQAHDAVHWAYAFLALVFLGAVWSSARYLHETLDESIHSGLANARIADHLGRARVAAESAIQERLEALSHLQASEARYRHMLENLPSGVVLYDSALIVTYCNRRMSEILSVSAEQMLGFDLKTLNDPSLVAALRVALAGGYGSHEGAYRTNGDGSEVTVSVSSLPLEGLQGEASSGIAVVDDITTRKRSEVEIQRLAFTDPLTELPNRRLLADRLKQALALSVRSGRPGALLLFDLDNFKALNDTLGHDVGDLLLKEVGRRLKAAVRESDTVARFGGDEFVVMLEDIGDTASEGVGHVQSVGDKLIAALGEPYQLGLHVHLSTASAGITLFDANNHAVDELLKQADMALYQAKGSGRNTMCFFNDDMQRVMLERTALEADLRLGLSRQQFVVYYQPQLDFEGRLIGAEALVRWQHPTRGLVMPGGFITLSEDTGLIVPLGQEVLRQACAQLTRWREQSHLAGLTLSVNVSVRQFREEGFVDELLALLAQAETDPRLLKLELTETLLASNVADMTASMHRLKAHGVGFSLDDFGTGYSSLSYLKRLPLDQLKIDQSFVRDILIDANDAAIARMVVALAKSMNLSVIAEGVETLAQRDYLAQLGCRAYQGYLFNPALTVERFEQYALELHHATQATQSRLAF